jgi:hypothetical protein
VPVIVFRGRREHQIPAQLSYVLHHSDVVSAAVCDKPFGRESPPQHERDPHVPEEADEEEREEAGAGEEEEEAKKTGSDQISFT